MWQGLCSNPGGCTIAGARGVGGSCDLNRFGKGMRLGGSDC